MPWKVAYTGEFGAWWEGLTGNDRWYEEFVPTADRLYDAHLATLKREGLI